MDDIPFEDKEKDDFAIVAMMTASIAATVAVLAKSVMRATASDIHAPGFEKDDALAKTGRSKETAMSGGGY